MTTANASGRKPAGRVDSRFAYCAGCSVRIMVGEPTSRESWPSALSLTEHQRDLLLQAAAEYRDLCAEAGEYESAVAFIDWMAIDALGYGKLRVEYDGAPSRSIAGGIAQRNAREAQRHPWPLPTADWRPARREGSG